MGTDRSSSQKQNRRRLLWRPKPLWVTRAFRTRKQRLIASCSIVIVATAAVALIAQGVLATPHVSNARNNEGLSLDTNPGGGNFDGLGNSYSQTALAAKGFTSGGTVIVQGITFTWPTVIAGAPDNWQSAGQVIPLPAAAGAHSLALLGSASNGQSSGTATITYTDATTQNFTLTLSDWTLSTGKYLPIPGDSVAASLTYRNRASGQQTLPNYVFYTSVSINSTKTVKSLTLPATLSGGQLHVFSVGVGTATTSNQRNNEGLSLDTNNRAGNFDGTGSSFSQTALAAKGFASGGTITVFGTPFTWPTVTAGAPDNWVSQAQSIALPAISATTLGILGAASNGQASGTAIISYKGGTTQNFTLTLSDWTLGGGTQAIASGDQVATTMTYRNRQAGPQNVTTYIFYTAVNLDPTKVVSFVTLPGTITGGQLHILSLGLQKAAAPTNSNWTQYLGNNSDTSYNAAETTITAVNVGGLKPKWNRGGNKGISGGFIELNGSVYWGDYNGVLHDTNINTGVDIWKIALGVTTDSCGGVGVGSTPNYQVINGVPALLVGGGGNDAAGGGNTYVLAINANTGAIIWKTVVGNANAGDTPWSSPLVYKGNVYYAVASFGDCPLTRGVIYKIAETTGAIVDTFWTEPPGCTAGDIWGTPSIDPATGILYTATGTQSSCVGQPGDLSVAVLAINTQVFPMALVGNWRIPNNQLISDSDFGSSPTLFTGTINGVSTPLVGVANKNGWYYTFRRSNISAGPVWEDYIATNVGNTPAPFDGDGSISPSSWDGTTLYLAGGMTTINGKACNGGLRAVNPSTGAYIWQVCLTNPNGWVLGAVMEIPGVVFVNSGNTVQAFNAATGAHLFTYTDTAAQFLWGPLTVANSRLYDGDMSGNFFALGL
jgi:hypothetical protein